MKQYEIRTDNHWSGIISTKEEALERFEVWKDSLMGEGVSIDESYVELIEISDDFETETAIKKAIAVIDEDMHKDAGEPRQNGYDFDFWAKWKEV